MTTLNQNGEAVQISVGNLIVQRRLRQGESRKSKVES
jgi:hypothetical protein